MILQKVLFLILLAFFLWGSLCNVAVLCMVFVVKVLKKRQPKRVPSLIPIVSGAVGVAAFCVSPYPILRHYAWLPILIDPGTSLMMPSLISGLWKDLVLKSRFFTVACLRPCDCSKTSILITLYSSGDYVYVLENEYQRLSITSKWSYDNDILRLTVCGKPVEYSVIRGDGRQSDYPTKLNWANNSAHSVLDGIDLLQVSGRPL